MFLDYGGKMRKFKYLLATGLISAALLVGCGSESDKKDSAKDLTPKEFFEEIQNSAQKDVKSAEYEMSAKIDVEGANEDSSISGDAKIKGDVDIDSGSVHMNISGSLMEKFLQQSSIDGYLTIEDTEGTVYLSMDNGPWAKKSVDVSDYINQISNLIMETPADGNTDFDADEALKFLKDTKVKSDDDGYTFTGTMDIDKIFDYMKSEGVDEDEIAEYKEVIKGLNLKLSITVDNDFAFTAFEMSVKDFEIPLMGQSLKINEATIGFKLTMSSESKKITIPDEALNATSLD